MPGPSRKYVPDVKINAAPRMISANEQFDDSLSEPTEDFRDDFNPSYGDDDDGDKEESEEGEDIEEEENEKRDSGYGSQGQIKKPVSG